MKNPPKFEFQQRLRLRGCPFDFGDGQGVIVTQDISFKNERDRPEDNPMLAVAIMEQEEELIKDHVAVDTVKKGEAFPPIKPIKTKWKKTLPDTEGWRWVKISKRKGVVMVPVYVHSDETCVWGFFDGELRTFYRKDKMPALSLKGVLFGPLIPVPL